MSVLDSFEAAVARVRELEAAIREHRAQKADDRCVEDDDRLYAVLGDGIKCDRRVGSKEEMLKNCARFIERRCEAGHWPTYAALELDRNRLTEALIQMERERDDLKVRVARLLSDRPSTDP